MTGGDSTSYPQGEGGHKAAMVALAGIYMFAFAGPWSTTLVDFGIVMMLAGSLFSLSAIWADIRRERIFWLVMVFFMYVIAHTAIHLHLYPDLDGMKNPHWNHWLRSGGIWSLLLGWWLYRNPDHVKPLLLTLLAGLILGTFYQGDHRSLLASDIWSRWVWGYSPNYLGMASGFALLILASWLAHGRRGSLSLWEWAAASALLLILSIMFLSSGSRSAWVAFPFGFAVIVAYALLDSSRRVSVKPLLVVIGLMFLSVLTIIVFQPEFLLAQLLPDSEAVSKFLALEWAEAARVQSSFGHRLAIWFIGFEAFLQRPLFGWGAGSGGLIVYSDELPYRHFHSIYIEVLVSFGLIGAFLLGWLHVLLYARVIAAARSGSISRPMFIALASVTVFFLMKMTNEIRIGQSEGRALITTLYAFYAYAMFRFRACVHD